MESSADGQLLDNRTLSTVSSNGVTVTVSPSVNTPDRTIDGHDVSSSGKVNPGDELEAVVTAPSDQKYVIEIRNVEEEIVAFTGDLSGDSTVILDTGDMPGDTGTDGKLEPGTYAVVLTNNGTKLDVAPFVVQAYETTAYVQEVLEAGDDLPVVTELAPLPQADGFPIDSVELVEWQDGGNGTRYPMKKTDDLTYETVLTDPLSPPLNVETAVLTPADESEEVDTESVGISESHTVRQTVDTLQWAGSSDAGGSPQFSTPAVESNRVFVGGLDSRVVAVSKSNVTDDATPIWTYERGGSLSDSSPAVSGGTLYIGGGGGKLYALTAGTDETSGSVEWTYPTGKDNGQSAITSSPLVNSGVVYAGANDGTFYAVDAETGSLNWTVDVGGAVYSRPAVSGDTVLVTTADGRLVALDTASKSVAWEHVVAGDFGASGPVVDSGTVYAAAENLYAFDVAGTGDTPLWTGTEYGGTAGSTPFVYDGRIHVGSRDRHLYVYEAVGTVAWTYQTRNAIATRPTVIDGRIIVGSVDGSVYVLDGANGDLRAAAYLDVPVRSSPVGDGEYVYVGLDSGTRGDGLVAALDINRL